MTVLLFNLVILNSDELYCNNLLTFIENNTKFKYRSYVFHKYDEDFKNFVKNNSIPTIYILELDLNSDGICGINAAIYIKHLKNDYHQIIYLTEDRAAAVNAINFHTHPVGFVCKKEINSMDIMIHEIKKATKKIKKTTDKIDEKYIDIYIDRKPVRLAVTNIIYFRSTNNMIVKTCVIKNKTLNIYSITCSLSTVCNKIGNSFFKLNQALYINMLHVTNVIPEKSHLELNCGIVLEIPQKTLEELLRCMQRHNMAI